MRAPKAVEQRCWRWRSNPLRRHDDVVETWIVLVTWIVIALGGVFVGLITAQAAGASFTQLRNDRHTAQAVLVESTAHAARAGRADVYGHVWAQVRWKASDGSVHTGSAPVDSRLKVGSPVTVWVNGHGQITDNPPATGEAAVEAGTLGAGAAAAFGGVVFAAGRLARWRLDQRRYDQWAREWEQVEPGWGRRMT
ncbi:hypothetical protein ACFVTY_32805 [Streptomyces sp. NPDC058067]|uniref:Uncharacterized protein n=1 Tax=Streptomyces antnestii TaxID=2494256 RepID=A0A437Q0J4_9ACTN|nr:hypothetical protein [Streptomyces sp. San01]RVU28026.1 hypothetical protein EOT10_07120 [Streptomyces sp. San01]